MTVNASDGCTTFRFSKVSNPFFDFKPQSPTPGCRHTDVNCLRLCKIQSVLAFVAIMGEEVLNFL
jgi:hypothetical protein